MKSEAAPCSFGHTYPKSTGRDTEVRYRSIYRAGYDSSALPFCLAICPDWRRAMTCDEPTPPSFQDDVFLLPRMPKGPLSILAIAGAANVAWILWLCSLTIQLFSA
jgi:hypothetical protein